MRNSEDILHQLATALDIPAEAFLSSGKAEAGRLARLHACAELMDAFARIDDLQARRRCLTYVRAEAERLDKASDETGRASRPLRRRV
ncbi:hypothetical protein SAMN05216360_11022 [Methylobacterium phyllostachyos]|uniref:Uncharacterized protein n=1 Tax=Methylobacterium phyllostachyos TaxID=582672 RepID=A0A1H0D529_9HYPH|nr:hypothetical protein [Methylobacterium phyllostachyos]SDN65165.1 hypothetical protein SAMN05216360_11022 [Methylobacterium phyllostachyos]